MPHVTAITPLFQCARQLSRVLLLSALSACAATPADETSEGGVTASTPSTAGNRASGTAAQPSAAGGKSTPTAGAAAGSSATVPQRAAAGTSAASGVGTAAAAGAAAAAAGGAPAAGSGMTAAAAAGATAGRAAAEAAGASTAAGAAGTGGGNDPTAAAKGFAELFLDAPCDSATRAPLADMATCNHPPMTQHIEKPVMFGGEPGKKYAVTLRVRGIWEPTNITGGMRPIEKQPFTIGGTIAGGTGSSSDSVNYQQYYIEVTEPKQTYWLNDYQYVAHDIHKQDYEATLTIAAGSAVKVVMNDGNEREIANYPKQMFSDVPPYDKMPSLGQSLRLDVVKVEVAP